MMFVTRRSLVLQAEFTGCQTRTSAPNSARSFPTATSCGSKMRSLPWCRTAQPARELAVAVKFWNAAGDRIGIYTRSAVPNGPWRWPSLL